MLTGDAGSSLPFRLRRRRCRRIPIALWSGRALEPGEAFPPTDVPHDVGPDRFSRIGILDALGGQVAILVDERE